MTIPPRALLCRPCVMRALPLADDEIGELWASLSPRTLTLTALRLELLSKFLLSRLFSAFLSRSMSFRRVEVGLGLDRPSSGTGDEGPADPERLWL